MKSSTPIIHTIPLFVDNYAYLIEHAGQTIVVDPGESRPIIELLELLHLKLTHVLITHYDFDHIGGCEALKKEMSCQVIGSPIQTPAWVDRTVCDGEKIQLNGLFFDVLYTPGHRKNDICWYHEESASLWTGDTLFCAGCGRISAGMATQMYASLQRINQLPIATKCYVGHEYTLDNLRFAMSIEPKNEAIVRRFQTILQLRQQERPSVPSTLAEERATNPFLRCGVATVAQAVGENETSEERVFAALRRQKDHF